MAKRKEFRLQFAIRYLQFVKLVRDKHLHSHEHVLAEDLSQMLCEPKRFAAYLGIAKLYSESDLRALAKYVSQKKELPPETRGKYFFGALRSMQRKIVLSSMVNAYRDKKKNKTPLKMTKMSIVQLPQKVLREKAHIVSLEEIKGPRVQELISRMKDTLAASENGVGLAAPQIGESLQIFLISEEAEEIDKGKPPIRDLPAHSMRADDAEPHKQTWRSYVFINPVVKKISRKKTELPEGCLSVSGKFGAVPRPEKITVDAYDERGKKFTRSASKFVARVIQHELDHLQGVLFIDKASHMLESGHSEN